MSAASHQFEAGCLAHRRVWWLATLGLIAGTLVLALVSSTLQQFRSSRERLERVQISVRGFSVELNRISEKVRTTQEELLSGEIVNPRAATWPAELSDSLKRARALYSQPRVAAVLTDFQRDAGRFALLEEQCLDWHGRRLETRKHLGILTHDLEDRLHALTAAVATEASRQKLRTAGAVARFRGLDGTNAVEAARKMVSQLQSESDLTETMAEITELARFSSRLATEVNPDDLANLKTNLMAASLVRLRKDLVRTDPAVAAELAGKLHSVERVLFGTNAVGNATQGLDAGLYHWRQTHLRLEKMRGQHLKSIADTIRDFHGGQSALDDAMSQLVQELADSAEARLRLVWWNTLAVGVLASGLFMLLAASVARTIRRQMSDVEQARVSLTGERAQLAAFVEHAPAAVAMFDTNVRYIAVSRRWLVEYKLEGQEVIGRSHYEVLGDIPERWRQIHARCLAGEVERCDDDAWRPPGSDQDRHLRWEVRPWFDRDRRIAGLMMFSQDITVDRLREAELAHMRDVANEASRAKSDFLATMSHEIRTPMNGVLGFTNLLLDTPLSEEQRQFVQTIRNCGESLLNLINDILDFSKIEAGKLTVESIQFNLCELLEQAAELLSSQAEEKNLHLAIDYAVGTPQLLLGDPGRVRQTALNLLGNAIKFTSKGHVLIHVAPDPDRTSHLRISIRDTGIGIAPAKHALLFNKFTQTDSSTTRRFGGTGLGLAISKQLVDLMGGQIGVISDGSSGSTFWFSLPVPMNLTQPPRPTLPPDVARCRVLAVQQSEMHRQILSNQFRVLGTAHSCVADVREAIEALRNSVCGQFSFDVVILDQSDVQSIPELKQAAQPHSLGILICTPGNRWAELQKQLQGSFASCLVKPLVRTSHLISALSAACRMREEPTLPASAAAPAALPRSAISPLPPPGPVALSTPKPAPDPGPASSRTETRSPVPAKYRVLIAEDNPTNQLLTRRLLEDLGCHVDLAVNGREAVDLARQTTYDVIFMDCHMPEMDGFRATETIRRDEETGRAQGGNRQAPRRLPIVALTASAFEEDRQRARDAGMDGFIAKPVNKLELRRALTTWVDQTDNVSM